MTTSREKRGEIHRERKGSETCYNKNSNSNEIECEKCDYI